jgi:hypothetical protein
MTLQRRKPVQASVAFERVTPRVEDAVLVLSELIVTSRWQTGVSTRQYAKLWGVSESKVLEWYRAACATVKIVANPEQLQLIFNESMHFMISMMYDLKGVDDRGAIAACKTVMDTCVALMKARAPSDKPPDELDLSGKSERELLEIIARGTVVVDAPALEGRAMVGE